MKRVLGTATALLLASAALVLMGSDGNLAAGPFKPASDHLPQVVAPTSSPSDNNRDLAGSRAPVPANPGRPINPAVVVPHQAAPAQPQPSACAKAGQGPQKPGCIPG